MTKRKVKQPQLKKITKTVKRLALAHKVPSKVTPQYPFGMSKRLKMKYCDYFSINPVVNVIIGRLFNLNSTFDPDRTGIGHQPLGRDQMATYFNRYRVHSCSYKITAICSTANASPFLGFAASNESLAPTDASGIAEISRTSTLMAYQQKHVLRGKIDLAILNGKSKDSYEDDELTAAHSGNDPTEIMLGSLFVHSDANCNIRYVIELIYDTEWFDPIQVGQS